MAHAGMATEVELQEKYYEQGKVFILQIESTLRCGQLCNYCYADSKPLSSEGLSSVKIKEILDSAVCMDIKMIDWLGGDPLLRADWYDLCKYASKIGLINNIWTSGIPLANMEIARKAVEVSKDGFISTHLDTLDPDIYEQLHGGINSSNNIRLILKGIKNAIVAGKSPQSMVNCITYTTPLADGDAKAMISYMQEKFGIKTCLTLFNPVIHRNVDSSWEPTIEQIKDAFEHRDAINYPDDPSCGAMDVSKFYCATSICVKADGWIVPCSVITTKEFGNVLDEKLETLIERNKRRLIFLDFRDSENLPGNCSHCENNSYCFGCRSSAFYYEGDIMASDPKCYQFKSDKLKEM